MIDSVTPNHAGTYTCTVRNQAASASYSTVLSVSGWSQLNFVLFFTWNLIGSSTPISVDAPALFLTQENRAQNLVNVFKKKPSPIFDLKSLRKLRLSILEIRH